MQSFIDLLDRRGAAWIIGLLGVGITAFGSLISALAYRGRLGETYNPLNHFVSELGEVGVSPLAAVFNFGIFAGGLCLVVFLLGLGRRIGGWYGLLFTLVGAACGLSGALVGIFPMNNLAPHIVWAMRFFNLGLLTSAIFSLLALLKRGGLSRWLALPGAFSALAFAAFLYVPTSRPGSDITAGVNPLAAVTGALSKPRPAVWSLAVLEWLALGSVMIWALVVAAAMLWEHRAAEKQAGLD